AVERLRNLKRAADAEAAAAFRRQMGDVDARKDDAPGVGRNRAAGDTEQRGLTGPVGPDDAERLALGEREVERARDHHGAEALGNFFEGEDGRHAGVLATPLVPAKAGTQIPGMINLDSRLRGNER